MTTLLRTLFCALYAAILCFAQTSAANIIYTQPGAGAVARTVASKLQDTVSVKDFGATGNGSYDDTAAIQAAVDASGWDGAAFTTVFFPQGNYLVTRTITISHQRTMLVGAANPATMITFVPTTTASLFKFSAGASILFRCGMMHMGLWAPTHRPRQESNLMM